MRQFVIDTNVCISAHLLKDSPSRKAFDLAFEIGIVLRSEETIRELVETFIRPKFDRYISPEKRLEAIDRFERKSLLIRDVAPVKVCRDPKDDKFLALASSADLIITGDTDLLILSPFKDTRIVTPSEFLQSYMAH